MKEIKKQFGRRHGSRLTLAPDYWYLRGSEPAEMQNYIDWVGFMSCDLHDPLDTDVKRWDQECGFRPTSLISRRISNHCGLIVKTLRRYSWALHVISVRIHQLIQAVGRWAAASSRKKEVRRVLVIIFLASSQTARSRGLSKKKG